MHKLSALLSITLLSLPVYTSGTTCADNTLTIASEIDDGLKVINAARKRVLRGEQANGLTGDNLPAAASMPDLVWSCELAESAKQDLRLNCNGQKPVVVNDTVYFRRHDSSEVSLPRIMEYYLSAMEYTSLAKVDPKVIYSNEKDLAVYVNLIRSTATSIGCARNKCDKNPINTKYSTLCIVDQPGVADGQEIYEVAPNALKYAFEIECAKAIKEVDGKFNVFGGFSYIFLIQHEKNLCKILRNSPILVYGFPACPDNPYMTNIVRSAFLTRHNSQRSLLAMGIVDNGNTGKLCRNATQMPRLVYDCNLEKQAHNDASQCRDLQSEDTTNLRRNSHSYTSLTRTYEQAAKSTTMRWWSEIRTSSGITQPRNIFYTHLGISRFAKIASDTTTKIGCSIFNCKDKSMVNVVCHYETKLAHAQRLYAMGPTCNKCPDTCYNGLCPGATDGVKV